MQLSTQTYDVIVVGGGPAGAAAAAWIAADGWHVALLDRARFPRDKACGEFLTLRTRELLADLGAWESACHAGLRPVNSAVLCAPDGRRFRHVAPHGGPVGFACRRTALDDVLLARARAANVEIHEQFSVRSLLGCDDGCVRCVSGVSAYGDPTTLRARLVIGADGSHSLVARRLGVVIAKPRLQRIAVVTHWRGVPNLNDAIEMRARGDIVCGLSFPGQSDTESACSPDSRPGRPVTPVANLTLVAPPHQSSHIAGRAGEWVEQTLLAEFPEVAAQLGGATPELPIRTIGCFGHVCRTPMADQAMLIGDAVAFIDPFTGEGVYFALRGAQLAAETATKALRAGNTSNEGLQPYERARVELKRRYLLCDAVQMVVRTPALLNTAVHRLNRYPGVADLLLDVLGDMRSPEAVLHPMLVWRLLAPCF